MESIINYYYGIEVIKIEKYNDNYLIYTDEDRFLFSEIINDIKELEDIIKLLNETDIPYHLLVLTKMNTYFIEYEEKKYCLLKIRYEQNNIDINSFSKYTFKGFSNWANVWSRRVDYYEKQLNEMVKESSIKYAIQYYIGLAEISIAFANNLKELYSNVNYSLCHKRVTLPLNGLDYYNPLNIIVDIQIRDLAEYIKYAFFEDILNDYEIIEMVDQIKFSEALGNYFFLRLLYPSYFFYQYDEYIENGEVSNKIFEYMKKSKDYETLLSKIYSRLKTYIDIKINLWFIKSQHL